MAREAEHSERAREIDSALQALYPELRRRAEMVMRGERIGHTLQPTALVHEAILRLMGDGSSWSSEREFLLRACHQMGNVLIDYARRRKALKRGNGQIAEEFDERLHGKQSKLDRVVALAQALEGLREVDQRAERVAVLRFLMDLSEAETAEVLDISTKTVERDWQFARAWLRRALAPARGPVERHESGTG
ncbi:MAG: ECF-type sigma factor [Bryobacteraceae bacterium]